jgi:hypothetical protein
MSEPAPNISAAEALREAAAVLLAKADQLDALARQEEAEPAPVSEQPLAPAATEDEAKARIVAFDLAQYEIDRDRALELLREQFPEVDVESLVNRFFKG